MDKKIEVVDPKELETLPQQDPIINEDSVAAIIRIAESAEMLATALDKIRKVCLSRALPGDWVEFKEGGKAKEGEAPKESFLSLGGAGAERVASFMGISFTNWKDWKETEEDSKGKFYNWFYSAEADFKGRRIRVEGRAGSRDQFFGFAYGQMKKLEDIKEVDIRTAARRNCMKEGINVLMGFRRIPRSAAAALGLDLSKVRTVEFGSRKDGTAASGLQKDALDVVLETRIKKSEPAKMDGDKVVKKAYTIYAIKFASGVVAETFSKTDTEAAKALIGKKVSVKLEENGSYAPKLLAIAEATSEQLAAATADKEPDA